jgi:MFS family permease
VIGSRPGAGARIASARVRLEPASLFGLSELVAGLGDLFDRKRLILAGQTVMLLAAAVLGALDVARVVTPAVLLLLLSAIGVGQGLTGPIAQTLQPELVPAEERPQAIALGSVNQNLARAIGPAIGGALLAITSAAVVFFVNAASFVAVLVVVAMVAVPVRTSTLPREHFRSATHAGVRFVRNSPALLAIMARAAASGFFATGLWALLPLVARRSLGLGSGGYGLLLGCVGIGAVAGATFSPFLRRALSPRALLTPCALVIAGATLVIAASRSALVDGVVLTIAGMGWIVAPAESMPPVQAPDATLGAVLVTVTYDLAPGTEDAFLARAERLRHARQRTGGIDWRLFRDTAVPGRFLETFLVASWEEHERQHSRLTQQDAALLSELDGLLTPRNTTPGPSLHGGIAGHRRDRSDGDLLVQPPRTPDASLVSRRDEGRLRVLHLRPYGQLQAREDDPSATGAGHTRRGGRRDVLLRRQHLRAAGGRSDGRAPGAGGRRARDAADAL